MPCDSVDFVAISGNLTDEILQAVMHGCPKVTKLRIINYKPHHKAPLSILTDVPFRKAIVENRLMPKLRELSLGGNTYMRYCIGEEAWLTEDVLYDQLRESGPVRNTCAFLLILLCFDLAHFQSEYSDFPCFYSY